MRIAVLFAAALLLSLAIGVEKTFVPPDVPDAAARTQAIFDGGIDQAIAVEQSGRGVAGERFVDHPTPEQTLLQARQPAWRSRQVATEKRCFR